MIFCHYVPSDIYKSTEHLKFWQQGLEAGRAEGADFDFEQFYTVFLRYTVRLFHLQGCLCFHQIRIML